MARRKKKGGVYHFFIVLPDRLYPFSAVIDGKRVRGMRAYERTIAYYERKYGRGHFGAFINCYRTFFHIIGSIIVITAIALIAREFLGTERALYVLLSVMTLLVTYQEFYYHRRHYQQLWKKGVLDWLSWVVPIGLYLFLIN